MDVKFNDNGTRILASRILIQAVNISDTNHEKEMVKDLREISKQAPIKATVFHPYFVFFDQFELVRPTSLRSMIVGALIMMLISFIFIPNILCSLWVALSIVSIELGVAGYMSLWDVNLDSISMINLIMCIGFSVDFTAHICYTYMSSKSRRPDGRVREALYSLGMPIIQGAFSTVLGCVGLLLANSYIFLVFFKIIFLVIFFGAMHGLLLLPVLLSLFGPGSCTPDSEFDDDEENLPPKLSAIEKVIFPQPYCIPHPQLALTGPLNGKTFLGAPYKQYGIGGDDKDQGIGTSGEDSSESSSSKSQRKQALEDENTRRRYEEGWRRSSSHNLANGPSQFQPVGSPFGVDDTNDNVWTTTNRNYSFDDSYVPQRKPSHYDLDREMERRKISDSRLKPRLVGGDDQPQPQRYYDDKLPVINSNTIPANGVQASNRYQFEEKRRYSDEYKRKVSDERRPRKYSPPEGIYRTNNANRSTSQHNIYYPRQPQRSSSYHNIHQLRYMGDIRFP